MKNNILKVKKSGKLFKNFRINIVFLFIFLIILAVICYIPFYIMIINGTRTTTQINMGISLLPGTGTAENYIKMQQSMNIWRGFLNSILIAVPSTLFAGYFGALTAYAFSKFKFRGNRILFWLVLATMMIPTQLGLVGYYQLAGKLHLIDTLWAIILPAIANAGTVFFLKMYIDANVNDTLLEAARIDGSNEFYIFNRIVFPIITPGVAMMSILNFVAYWNNYITPLALLNTKDKFPLPILIALVKGTYKQNIGSQYLAVGISIIPIIISFMFFSRYIISGVAAGAIKE
ncbi:MAG: carbohydrate ABC transporter permease [Actinomycetota bacterium]